MLICGMPSGHPSKTQLQHDLLPSTSQVKGQRAQTRSWEGGYSNSQAHCTLRGFLSSSPHIITVKVDNETALKVQVLMIYDLDGIYRGNPASGNACESLQQKQDWEATPCSRGASRRFRQYSAKLNLFCKV